MVIVEEFKTKCWSLRSVEAHTHPVNEREWKRAKESEREEKIWRTRPIFLFIVSRLLTLRHVCGFQPIATQESNERNGTREKNRTEKKIRPLLIWFRRLFPVLFALDSAGICAEGFKYYFIFLHTHNERQTYGKLNFIGSSLWENEPNCHNNKGMTSLQTRDRSFTTNQATGMCKHVGTRIKSLFLSKRISSTRNIFTLLNATLLLVSLAPAFPIVNSVHCSCVCVCARIYKSIVWIHFSTTRPENDEKSMRFSD